MQKKLNGLISLKKYQALVSQFGSAEHILNIMAITIKLLMDLVLMVDGLV